MTPIEQLYELAADLDTVGRPDHSARLRSIIVELRPYFSPLSWQDESAPDASAHFKAWAAVYDELKDRMPFDGEHTPTERAVAAIRSMAAQCSAQSAQVIPIAWPEPVAREQLDVLQWTIGYFQGCGYVDAAKSIDVTLKWLQKNGCDQIR